MTILDKYQALKHNDGRMLAVMWPEKSLYVIDDDGLERYQAACEQAIANGIEFKEKDDVKQIEHTLCYNGDMETDFNEWQIEEMKPYPLPEGIELEIRVEDWKGSPIVEQKCQFAFIKKHEPKEEVESQDELWDEAERLLKTVDIRDREICKAKFRIERIKK